MSGVLGHRFGRRNSRMGVERSSVKYWLSSDLVLRHAKDVYDWLKPTFASRYISLGRVNASERKITSASSLRFDHHLDLAPVRDGQAAVGVPFHELGQVGAKGRGSGGFALAELRRASDELFGVRS